MRWKPLVLQHTAMKMKNVGMGLFSYPRITFVYSLFKNMEKNTKRKLMQI
jgi:hypothetical protein